MKDRKAKSFLIFREAFLVSASNPKTVIFLSAFLPQFIEPEASVSVQFGIMYLTIAAIVLCIHLFYAYTLSKVRGCLAGLELSTLLSKLTGGTFMAMGGGVMLSDRL